MDGSVVSGRQDFLPPHTLSFFPVVIGKQDSIINRGSHQDTLYDQKRQIINAVPAVNVRTITKNVKTLGFLIASRPFVTLIL